jgi:hypothetical protein
VGIELYRRANAVVVALLHPVASGEERVASLPAAARRWFFAVVSRMTGRFCPSNKRNKNDGSFVRPPLKTTTLGVLAVIFCFFSLPGVYSA